MIAVAAREQKSKLDADLRSGIAHPAQFGLLFYRFLPGPGRRRQCPLPLAESVYCSLDHFVVADGARDGEHRVAGDIMGRVVVAELLQAQALDCGLITDRRLPEGVLGEQQAGDDIVRVDLPP